MNPTEAFKFTAVSSTAAESIFIEGSEHYLGVWEFIKQYSVPSDEEGIEAVYNG